MSPSAVVTKPSDRWQNTPRARTALVALLSNNGTCRRCIGRENATKCQQTATCMNTSASTTRPSWLRPTKQQWLLEEQRDRCQGGGTIQLCDGMMTCIPSIMRTFADSPTHRSPKLLGHPAVFDVCRHVFALKTALRIPSRA